MRFLLFFLVAAHIWASSAPAQAGSVVEKKVPPPLVDELRYVLSFVGDSPDNAFDPRRVENLLDFMSSAKERDLLYYAPEELGKSSAYYEVDVERDLGEVLRFTFNPDIPYHSFTPSSTRYSTWRGDEIGGETLPPVWALLSDLDGPRIVRGVEFVENTPDVTSGAYYNYTMDRVLILFRHRDRKVLFSLSKQRDVSSVGKKGYVLPPDENWDYFYSENVGVALPGLSWVRSYMYDSYAISAYLENGAGEGTVRYGCFKWVDAGWMGINMVKKTHIYGGLARFGRSFKEIIEHPSLPDSEELSRSLSSITRLPEGKLREKAGCYLDDLSARWQRSRDGRKDKIRKIVDGGKYLANLKKEELEGLLVVEYMKQLLGRNTAGAATGISECAGD